MLTLLLFVNLFRVASFHDIHISYGQSEIKGSTYSGKITYYRDDLLKAVGKWYQKDIATINANDLDSYQKNYFQNYFRVWENNVQLTMSSVSREEDASSVIFNFTYAISPGCGELKIDHRALFDIYNDQLDIVSFKVYGKELNYIFKSSAPTYLLKK